MGGLIDPSGFPCKSADLDIEVIRSAKDTLASIGSTLVDKVAVFSGIWAGLPAVYQSPEALDAYTLLKPAETAADDAKSALDSAGKYIDKYADELEKIKTDLADVETRAAAFREKALKGYEHKHTIRDKHRVAHVIGTEIIAWDEYPSPYVDENNGLLAEYAAILERISAAAAQCADDIYRLATLAPENFVPATRVTADQILNSPEDMPWGGPATARKNCVHQFEEGVNNSFHEAADGIVQTVTNPLKAARQTADVLTSLVATSYIAIGYIHPLTHHLTRDMLNGNSGFSSWHRDRLRVTTELGAGLIQFDLQAHEDPHDGKSGWHKWQQAPVTAGTQTFISIVSLGLLKKPLKRLGVNLPHLGSNLINRIPSYEHFKNSIIQRLNLPDFKNSLKIAKDKIADSLPFRYWVTPDGQKIPLFGGDGPGRSKKPFDVYMPENRSHRGHGDTSISPNHKHPGGGGPSHTPDAGGSSVPKRQHPDHNPFGPVDPTFKDKAPQRSADPDHPAPGTDPNPVDSPDPGRGDGPGQYPDTQDFKQPDPELDYGEAPDGGPTHDRYGREYHYLPDGKRTLPNDPPNTFRDINGQLHDAKGPYAKDPNVPDGLEFKYANQAASDSFNADDFNGNTAWDQRGTTYAQDNNAYLQQVADRTKTRTALTDYLDEHNLNIKTEKLSKNQYQKTLDDALDRGEITDEQWNRLRDLAQADADQFDAMSNMARDLGERATDEVIQKRGETALLPAKGAAGAGEIDQLAIGHDNGKPYITVYESKGGTSRLGDRVIDGKRYQQGTAEYLDYMFKNDPRIKQAITDYQRQHPGSGISIDAINKGDLPIKYEIVKAARNSTIQTTKFKIQQPPTLPE